MSQDNALAAQAKRMKNTRVLLIALLMLTVPLAGCLGGDDDDATSPVVGDWYYAEDLAIEFNEDGTTVAHMALKIIHEYGEMDDPRTSVAPNSTGTWRTDGVYLNVSFGDSFEESPEGAVGNGTLYWSGGLFDGWLWWGNGADCTALAPEAINQTEWDDIEWQDLAKGNVLPGESMGVCEGGTINGVVGYQK